MYNWTGVVIGMTQVLLPFMILSISSVVENIGQELTEMSEVLGATKFQTFLGVILPLSLDGIASGCIIVFMLTLGSFVTVMLLGGSTMVMSLLIYQQVLNVMDFNLASTIGTILLVTTLIFLYFQVKLIKRKGIGYAAKT
jgi:putative spermidine/putrescine transport system permease protein